MASELFVNAAWTNAKKVPKVTPFGVELVFGVNAFATLEEAKNYAVTHSLVSPVYHDGDKTVDLDNSALQLSDVRSQEIKPTLAENPVKNTYSAQSKITPKGTIRVTRSDVADLKIAGFKDVTISDADSAAGFSVSGGGNQVVHSDAATHAATTVTQKNSATITGKADGTLTVNGARLLQADGAWAAAAGISDDSIDTGVEEFKPAMPYHPDDPSWDVPLEPSLLVSGTPGYAAVTLADGATAALVTGGALNYSRVTELTRRKSDSTITALNKTLSCTTSAAGTLKVIDAAVGSAYRYANVSLDGATEFALIRGGGSAVTAKTTYQYTPSVEGVKTTSEFSSAVTATGNLTVGDIGTKSDSRDVSGYAKVTFGSGSAELGNIDGTNLKSTAKSSCDIVSSGAASEKITSSYSNTVSYAAGGTMTTGGADVILNSATGFSNVNLSSAVICGGIFAAAGHELPFSSSYSHQETYSGGIPVQSKTTAKGTSAAAGTVTLNSGTRVADGIHGYQTVKLTGASISGSLNAGKGGWEDGDSVSRTEKSGVVTSAYSSQYKDSQTAHGTLTMTGGDVYYTEIRGYATVTLDGTTGSATVMSALNTTSESKVNRTYVGAVQTLDENSSVTTTSGTGTLTVINSGGGMTISSLFGYGKVALTDVVVEGGIRKGGTEKELNYSKTTSDTRTDLKKIVSSSYFSGSVAGSVILTSALVSAGISGYQAVTLDAATVSANIVGSNYISSTAQNAEYTSDGGTLLKSSYAGSSSDAPTMTLILKNSAIVLGDADGVKTLNLNSATVGDVNMESFQGNSTCVNDTGKMTQTSSYRASNAATGTVTATDAIAGHIYGAAKVTATNTTLGYLGSLLSSSVSQYTETSSGGAFVSTDSYKSAGSAAATAMLTSVDAGWIEGFANVKLVSGSISGAYACNFQYALNETSSTKLYSSSYSDTWNAGGAFTAAGTYIGAYVSGYKTLTLNSATVDGDIGADQSKYSRNIKTTYTSDGKTLTGQLYTNEDSYSTTATATIRDTYVAGGANGFKTLNLTAATINSSIDMSFGNNKETNNITSNQKTALYEQKWQSVYSYGAGGTFTAIDGAWIGDGIYGADKVTLTSSFVTSGVSRFAETYSSILTAKGTKLTATSSSYAVDVDSNYAVEWNGKYSSASSAGGTLTLTDGDVGGAVVGYANVKLTRANILCASAGASKSTSSHIYKDSLDVFTSTYSSGLAGTLTATDASFLDTGTDICGFATVTLTDCICDGAIEGGGLNRVWSGSGAGANFAAAMTAAEGAAVTATTYKNAGKFTATRLSQSGGNIAYFATVTLTDCETGSIDSYSSDKATLTLAGGNTVGNISGCTTVTVKNGDTAANDYSGTDGADTITVNAGATLTVSACAFGGGSDKLVINGLVRLLGPVSNSGKIALSGTGLTATTDSNYTKLTDDLEKGLLGDVSFSGSLELVNAGKKESTVRAIRTRKEELADNKVSGARDFSGETMNGWLSGEEDKDHGKFADTEDWIKFRYDDSSVYSVLIDDNARQADLKVEVRQGGTLVQEVAWISYNNWFLLDTSTFAADAEYQLRLTVENGKEALAYTFNKS